MKKKRAKIYYVGFTTGKLCVEDFRDTYGQGSAVVLFTSKAAATRRFQDVRAVKLVAVNESTPRSP